MAKHRVICTRQEPPGRPHDHALIVGLGTGADPKAPPEKEWNLHEVLRAMKAGDTFYTQGVSEEDVATVGTYHCHTCGQKHVRTRPDGKTKNNLNSLPDCI